MGDMVRSLLLLLFAATVSEGIIEFLITPILDLLLPKKTQQNGDPVEPSQRLRVAIFNWLSGIFGVVIALGFRLELFSMLGGVQNIPFIDAVLTGVLIGRGSNYIHGLLKKFFLENEIRQQTLLESRAYLLEKKLP